MGFGPGGNGGVSTFDALTDTPASKTGQAGKYARVNGLETAIEYVVGGGGTFDSLTDTPVNKTGHAFKIPRVNAGETALEFIQLIMAGAICTASSTSTTNQKNAARLSGGR